MLPVFAGVLLGRTGFYRVGTWFLDADQSERRKRVPPPRLDPVRCPSMEHGLEMDPVFGRMGFAMSRVTNRSDADEIVGSMASIDDERPFCCCRRNGTIDVCGDFSVVL